MWIWKSDWGWCLGGAYFLAKFQAGGAYSVGAYKKPCRSQILDFRFRFLFPGLQNYRPEHLTSPEEMI